MIIFSSLWVTSTLFQCLLWPLSLDCSASLNSDISPTFTLLVCSVILVWRGLPVSIHQNNITGHQGNHAYMSAPYRSLYYETRSFQLCNIITTIIIQACHVFYILNCVKYTCQQSLSQKLRLHHHHAGLKNVFQLQSLKILENVESIEKDTKMKSYPSSYEQEVSKAKWAWSFNFT